MKIEDIKVGMKVRSKVNAIYGGTYTVTAIVGKKLECVTDDNLCYDEDDNTYQGKPTICKNVSPGVLLPAELSSSILRDSK